MNKKISNHTRLHALTRQFIDICILAPLREPCKLRVRPCKRVSYLLIFSFIYKKLSSNTCIYKINKSKYIFGDKISYSTIHNLSPIYKKISEKKKRNE